MRVETYDGKVHARALHPRAPPHASFTSLRRLPPLRPSHTLAHPRTPSHTPSQVHKVFAPHEALDKVQDGDLIFVYEVELPHVFAAPSEVEQPQ